MLTLTLRPAPTTDEGWDDEAARLLFIHPDAFWYTALYADVGNSGLRALGILTVDGNCGSDEKKIWGIALIRACKRMARDMAPTDQNKSADDFNGVNRLTEKLAKQGKLL